MSQCRKTVTRTRIRKENGVVIEEVVETIDTDGTDEISIPEIQKLQVDSKPEDKPRKNNEESPEQQKKELERSALEAHNRHRAKHGVLDLTLAEDLCEMAQKWADYLASRNCAQHSDCKLNGESVGENLANKWSSSGQILTGEEATDMWYSEIKDYNFNTPGFRSGIGHFTQVVWKGSKELGIGRGIAENGACFVVANYRPAGNYNGKFEENVLRPI